MSQPCCVQRVHPRRRFDSKHHGSAVDQPRGLRAHGPGGGRGRRECDEKWPDQNKERNADEGKSKGPPVHSISLAFPRVQPGYNPRMRTGVFTALAIGLLALWMMAQSAQRTTD
jgi:hypothetical protein